MASSLEVCKQIKQPSSLFHSAPEEEEGLDDRSAGTEQPETSSEPELVREMPRECSGTELPVEASDYEPVREIPCEFPGEDSDAESRVVAQPHVRGATARALADQVEPDVFKLFRAASTPGRTTLPTPFLTVSDESDVFQVFRAAAIPASAPLAAHFLNGSTEELAPRRQAGDSAAPEHTGSSSDVDDFEKPVAASHVLATESTAVSLQLDSGACGVAPDPTKIDRAPVPDDERLDRMRHFSVPSCSDGAEALPMPVPPMKASMQAWLRELSADQVRMPDDLPPDIDFEMDEDIFRKDKVNTPDASAILLANIHDPDLEWDAPVMTDCQAKSVFQPVHGSRVFQPGNRAGVVFGELRRRASQGPASQPTRPELLGKSKRGEVTLQVYNFGRWTQRSGLPIFHLGVEVYREEHFYSVGGVDVCEPGGYSCQIHREAIPLGRTQLSRVQVLRLLLDMRQEWLPGDYALLGRNCQDFAVAFCRALGVSDNLPEESCRFANMSAVLPPSVINGIREADRRLTSMQALFADWNPNHASENDRKRDKPCFPSRLGASTTTTNAGLPPVVLPLETEATVNL